MNRPAFLAAAVSLTLITAPFVGCGNDKTAAKGQAEPPGQTLLRFTDTTGRWTFNAEISSDGTPQITYTAAGTGGGRRFVAVDCGGWPLESDRKTVGDTQVLYGVAVGNAVAIRYPRINGGTDVIWTRKLPGLPLRWFAAVLHRGQVQGGPNDLEALDVHGRHLGSEHNREGKRFFPPYDGHWERSPQHELAC